jgi:NADH-quinone oxidoreductase subunit E
MSDVMKDVDLAPAEGILGQVEKHALGGQDVSSYLIPLLQQIQQAYGYLPVPVLNFVSRKSGIPTARMYGVITFYSQFYTEPHGRHTIKCCEGTACHVKGITRVAETIERELGVREGESTKDMRFTFEKVACLGTCFLAPVMMIDNDYYGQLTSDVIPEILKKYQ